MYQHPNLARQVYVATGSSIERLIQCASSIGLAHVSFETVHSTRGVAIHSYLETCSKDPDHESALAAVPAEWRDACEALDLSGLDVHLQLTAEIALAYDVELDTTRELGRGAGRIYDDVKETEIPCMLDVVGVRVLADGTRIGLVVDWKTGWLTRKKKVATDWQLKFGALAAARRFDLDVVEVQLINLSEGKPYVQRAVYTSFQLARIASEVATFYAGAVEVRALHQAGRHPATYNLGDWCEHCPSKSLCPPQRALITAALSLESGDISAVADEQLADLYVRATEAVKRLNVLREQIRGQVGAPGRSHALFLTEEADGKTRWLASVMSKPNEYLDGKVTFTVVREMLGEEYAIIAAPPEASKKALTAAVRAAQKKGVVRPKKGNATREAILAKIRGTKGGARKKSPAPQVTELVVDKPLAGGKVHELEAGEVDDEMVIDVPALELPTEEP